MIGNRWPVIREQKNKEQGQKTRIRRRIKELLIVDKLKMIPKIKICGLKHPENILDVLALQPDYVGFIFHPSSKRYIGQLDAEWLAGLQGAKKTGVFVNSPLDVVQAAVNDYGFQAVQLHGDESPDYCAAIRENHPVETIKAFGVGDTFDWSLLKTYEHAVDYYLFDTQSTQYGGTGRVFDWKLLTSYPSTKPYFLSGGLSHENIRGALLLNDSRLYAVDLNSKFEIKPGIKDIELLKKTFQLIKL